MANLLTTWAQATVAHLAENLTTNGESFRVEHGRRDGRSSENVACVFVAPTAEWPQDVNFLRPVLVVRAWLGDHRLPKKNPRTPADVEQLMADIWATLDSVRTSLMSPDFGYFEVTNVEPDYDDWGVQATLTAYALTATISG